MKAKKAAKSSSEKKLKKVALKPVRNLKATASLLSIDGIKGESSEPQHKDWIE
jgi:hypothetical protein